MLSAKQYWALGVAFAAASLLSIASPSIAYADETSGIAMELAVTAVAWLSSHANGILATAYERAPVLVTVLAALLILPVTALAALLAQSMRVRHAGRHKQNIPGTSPGTNSAPARPMPPPPPVQPLAWLRGPSGERTPLPPELALVRIGRHEDNDIRLAPSTVHRHHAIIHRTPAAEFIITDVSGAAGNGVVINGQRLTETRLKPGDAIQLGDAAFIFESALPAYMAAYPHPPTAVTISQPHAHGG